MPRKLPPFASHVANARYACLDMVPRRCPGMVVSCAGVEDCEPSYRVDRKGYACPALEFVSAGTGTLTLAGRTHRLVPGCFFTYGPGVAHVIAPTGHPRMRKYFVDFFGKEAHALLRRCGLSVPCFGQLADAASVRDLLDGLLVDASSAPAGREEIAGAYLRLILHKCGAHPPGRTPSDTRARATLQRALDVIESRHLTLQSLPELASAARVDPAHLCRLFARFRGESPMRHLRRRKLDTAARLLAGGGVLVKDAAAAAGFDDPLHFSRLFRRAFGCSPSEYVRLRSDGAGDSRKFHP